MISKRKAFIWLFAILYISVAFVSTFHAISFFGLANQLWIAVMLAITFEIGQAAVLFSILTNATKNKIIPWFLMIVLTLVQILGNVYSSYKYLITNSENLLQYFKEPIFVWTDMPDQQCNVILTYIIGAILPVVSLLMTSMVTNYLEKTDEPKTDKPKEKDITDKIKDIDSSLTELENLFDKNNEETPEIDKTDNEIEETQIDEKEKSHFVNLE